jgi:hypothetical protein
MQRFRQQQERTCSIGIRILRSSSTDSLSSVLREIVTSMLGCSPAVGMTILVEAAVDSCSRALSDKLCAPRITASVILPPCASCTRQPTRKGTHQQRTGRLAVAGGHLHALFFGLQHQPVHHCHVEVVAAQIRVAACG